MEKNRNRKFRKDSYKVICRHGDYVIVLTPYSYDVLSTTNRSERAYYGTLEDAMVGLARKLKRQKLLRFSQEFTLDELIVEARKINNEIREMFCLGDTSAVEKSGETS